MKHPILPFSLLAGVVLVWPVLAALPQATKDRDPKDTLKSGGSYMGKIREIDAPQRTLVLQDVKAVTRLDTKEDTVVFIRFRPGVATPPVQKDQAKTGGIYLFQAAPLTEISLDGKAAAFKSLKVGQFARVRIAKSNPPTATGTDKDTASKKDRWEVDRIEAFSKEPPATKGKG
jgi:hypothetical protein